MHWLWTLTGSATGMSLWVYACIIGLTLGNKMRQTDRDTRMTRQMLGHSQCHGRHSYYGHSGHKFLFWNKKILDGKSANSCWEAGDCLVSYATRKRKNWISKQAHAHERQVKEFYKGPGKPQQMWQTRHERV